MLVVVDSHPAFPGVIGSEERLEVVHFAGEIQRRIFFPGAAFPNRGVGFLHVSSFLRVVPALVEW